MKIEANTNILNQTVNFADKQKNKAAEQAVAEKEPNYDKVEISVPEKIRKLAEKSYELDVAIYNAQLAQENGDEMAEYIKNIGKYIEIAMRLSKGAKVPYQDEKALMEFNRDMYLTAVQAGAMAKNKSDEEYDSVFDEEDDNDSADDTKRMSEADIGAESRRILENAQKTLNVEAAQTDNTITE